VHTASPLARILLLTLAHATAAAAATVEVTVSDPKGVKLEDAVVWIMPRGGAAPPRKRDAAIEQKDRQFIPLVSVVQVGTAVNFPNRDPIRHHVYSFSPPKPFEIKLYVGTPAEPVVFDKPGEVVLGCNIHDHMLAYVYVVESPWFGKTGADGKAAIEGVPAGEYDVRLWHYAQAAAAAPERVKLGAEGRAPVTFTLATRPMLPRAAPK
jgi:plastocyanin